MIITKDTILIFTQQAKQYLDNQELHLTGPVTMLNGKDSLICDNMIFWYDIDSLQAFGNVNFQFKQNTLETDSMIYVSTDGFRGYSFEAYNESKFYKIHDEKIRSKTKNFLR